MRDDNRALLWTESLTITYALDEAVARYVALTRDAPICASSAKVEEWRSYRARTAELVADLLVIANRERWPERAAEEATPR